MTRRHFLRTLTLSVIFATAAVAVPLSVPQADTAGLDALLRAAVKQKRVPLVAAMVADRRGVIYERGVGVDTAAVFAIASMTKPITSVAAMQLVEAGKLSLDAPAATYVPELGKVQVLDNGALRAPRSPITVRHLFSHTSGFGYEFMSKELADLVAKKQLASQMAGGDGFMQAPLLFDPGTRWQYGISTDWLGRIVERVSGQSLEVYFREHIFEPLGMPDSSFDVPENKQRRVVGLWSRAGEGALSSQPRPPAKPGQFYSGGGGLFSTPRDYIRFVRAMMAGGQLDGRRILSAATVAEMRKNQIGDLTLRPMPSVVAQLAVDGATLPGSLDKFGLGFALNSTTKGTARGVNTMTWAGLYNTFFWIDAEKQVGAVLMSQMLPAMDPGPRTLLEDFDRAVYAMKATPKS
jgi:methyl acetate hydrolase